MSYVSHTWRLYAPDEDFDVATILQGLVAGTEPEDIDHWFENGKSVFSGRGIPPEHPQITKQICLVCQGAGCGNCCYKRMTYHWSVTPFHLIQESIDGLQQIIYDLNNPSEPHDVR